MRRVREARARIHMRDGARPGHVGDVENEQAVVPVADIEPVAHAQRVVAARRDIVVPRIFLAAAGALARNPPAPDLDRVGRVDQVEDHDDVADIAVGGRRDIGVAAVIVVAVNALAAGHPLGDQLRLGRSRRVVDRQPAAEIGRPLAAEALVVDDHQPVLGAHLVRVPAGRNVDGGDLLRDCAGRKCRPAWCRSADACGRCRGCCRRPRPGRRRGSRRGRSAWC